MPSSDWGPVPGSGKLGFPMFEQGKGVMQGAAGPDPASGAEQPCPGVFAGAHWLEPSVWDCWSSAGCLGDRYTSHCSNSVRDLNCIL